jgi:hypothetical protein
MDWRLLVARLTPQPPCLPYSDWNTSHSTSPSQNTCQEYMVQSRIAIDAPEPLPSHIQTIEQLHVIAHRVCCAFKITGQLGESFGLPPSHIGWPGVVQTERRSASTGQNHRVGGRPHLDQPDGTVALQKTQPSVRNVARSGNAAKIECVSGLVEWFPAVAGIETQIDGFSDHLRRDGTAGPVAHDHGHGCRPAGGGIWLGNEGNSIENTLASHRCAPLSFPFAALSPLKADAPKLRK